MKPEDTLGTGLYAILDKGEVGRGLGFQRESRQFTGRWEEQTCSKQFLSGPPRNGGT